MPKNIIDGRIDTSDIAMVDDETAERLSQHRMVPGDIVYGRRGDIGRRAYISENEAGWLCGTGCLRVSPGNRIVDPLFLYYYLGTSTATDWLKGQAIGATLPNLNTTILRNLSVPVPPIATQRQIADTLSAYDDLIENNTRRIAILEEMAQRLYREWFVHFRYPGHESVPLVNSDLGPIPEGWEWKELGELASETRRSVRPEDVDSNTPYVGLEHLPRRSITLRDGGRADEVASSKLRFDEGNILFGKIRPYFHKVVVAPFDGISSTDIIVIEPKAQEHFGLVLSCVSSDDFVAHAAQTSQGTKMPRAAWKTLRRYPMPVAPHCTNHLFNKLLDEIVGELKVLARKSEVCRRLRDLLIPKLIASIPSPNQKLETNAT